MEAKRFSRVNLSTAAPPDDPEGKRFESIGDRGDQRSSSAAGALDRMARKEPDGRQPATRQAGYSAPMVDLGGNKRPYMEPRSGSDDTPSKIGDIESPAWQEYFFLAPNVRFTRTPDYEARKHHPQHERVVEHGATRPTQQAVAQPMVGRASSAPSLLALPASVKSPASQPQTGHATQGPLPPAAAFVPSVRARERVPAVAPVPPRTVATGRASARASVAPGAPIKTERLRWPYLSDHAFFEAMAPYLVDVSPPARQTGSASPAPLAAAPVTTMPIDIRPTTGTDATALFRVIDCLPGQALKPLPDVWPANSNQAVAQPDVPASNAPSPVQPVAIPAAKSVAVSAPAAPSANVPAKAVGARSARLPGAGKVVLSTAGDPYELPSEELLQQPPEGQGFYMSQERLEQNADLLESVLEDFGVRGEIIHVRPGPVVTLYEFEPAPGVKSSRVIGLADDIARSMSAISARVAVVPGRNVIGIELPNEMRETVYFRELIESEGFRKTSCKLALCLGKTIGGEPVIAELAKMPHLLVAGTTGSGKSVAINTMILSLLYRLKPEECRLIMVDPKMLELSVYDGIPHLLTPVVTDPKKAVTALKWAVREMEDRYRKMARLGVRNIDGYNERAAQARDKGETVVMTVQTGFEKGTGEPLFEQQEVDLAPMPYIVVIVDEMADLMMVAGKEIEGAIQRLAQMARAAGIHLIMATQRPSVDVITGTIKANFPTRISFQVTSKIDSRTILGEQGAEQLLGQGDMLHMMGGGRISRVHGPFVSDAEVEHVVAHLKAQGRPEYLETVTADEDEEEIDEDQGAVFDKGSVAAEDSDAIYDEAVKVVVRDKKCSTSYIQRRLGIGYNRAASLVERMEKEGLVGAPNHVGKREIIMGRRQPATVPEDDGAD
ncbi:DNA translocase FtsK [Mesorhizobium sp. M7A.F.Ca.CA.001.09.2.1]|uniref:DNA translocase FtsK n=3 Tax=Mesorhizobium TaxID=68287 RepID=A0AB38TFA8_9HYPH|nr:MULTISPECIES: DNA translocase FtsK [Mesorhizobium]MDF3215466.1 DNA translocase FtsK [Mesorhizobium ciceri]RUY72188.1 DNA translocase FtsK [Mesorhizobium sp. M7A.F.Ca.CA.001.05.1.1]RUY72574.1 DNA translocase FtsK [Mesorhizobium sp. M7A.F.Ca.CA.001.13.1.1]RUY81498.1 DNA translocase FtsK [Mesorhizobium sp. M7A.F.Ca.CA.001.09.2.1]RUZ09420.1 DNA translocase FtsK [Mesorhizobium sp. M7A.F.Ca.CA.001.04.2.1]